MNDATITTVAKFGALQLQELRANEAKGEWSDWHPNLPVAIAALEDNFDKLKLALCSGDPALVGKRAADLANVVMKSWEVFGQ